MRESEQEFYEARTNVQAQYQRLVKRRNVRVALLKSAVIFSVRVSAAWLFRRQRNSVYSPIIDAFEVAVLLPTFAVIQESLLERFF